jgi:tetratricopeptide (TPR) repeat protein
MHDTTLPEAVRTAYRQLEQVLATRPDNAATDALAHSWRALEASPRNLEVLGQLVTRAAEAGLYGVAETFITYALTFHPESPQLHFALGQILKAKWDLQGALAAFRASLDRNPDNEDCYVEIAYVYQLLKRPGDLRSWLDKSLQKFPQNPSLLVLMGESIKRDGDSDAALGYFRRALKIAPEVSYLHQTLAHTRKFSHRDDEVAAMEALLGSRDRPVADQVRLCFALGKAYEDMADFATSFSYYDRGNSLVRAGNGYDESQTRRQFSEIEQAFDEALFKQFEGAGDDSDVPVFIVSMPRAGSTLIEKMLASHPSVFGAGELDLIRMIAMSIWGRHVKPNGSEFPSSISSLPRELLADAGRYCVSELKKLAGDKKILRITDKMPHNFLYVGLIRLILPNAKVIHCRRDPMDTCLSCFKHLFSGTHLYAYDLRDLGHYYRLYQQLMAHWNRVLPGWLLDVEYETLVQDQSGQLQRILDFCGLPWDDACMNFYKSKHQAMTASSVQVTKPLYSSAVGYWRNYEPWLVPLSDGLAGK